MQLQETTVAVRLLGAVGGAGGVVAIAENRYATANDRRSTATILSVFSNLGVMIKVSFARRWRFSK
jgi:hypothetical protein